MNIQSGSGLASDTSWHELTRITADTANFTFGGGFWLIDSCIQFPTNATGMRGVGIKIDTADSAATDVSGAINQTTVGAAPNVGTNVTNVCIQNVTAKYPVLHIMGRQNSGSAMGTSSSNILRVRVRAIHLCDAF